MLSHRLVTNKSNRKNHAFLRGTLVKLYDILRKSSKSNRFVCSITQPSLVQLLLSSSYQNRTGYHTTDHSQSINKKTRSHILIHFYFNKHSKYHSHPSLFSSPHSHFRHIIKQSVHHFRNLLITLSSLLSLPPSFLPSLHTTEPPNSQTPFDPLESRAQTERFGT